MINLIKCKFCNWQTMAWRTKKGKRVSGYPNLVEHVYIEHPEKFKEIQEYVEDKETRKELTP